MKEVKYMELALGNSMSVKIINIRASTTVEGIRVECLIGDYMVAK